MKEKQGTTLYNVIFPIWMLWVFPITWLVILPVNFAVDLLVVVLTMKALGVEQHKQNAKRVILRVWLLGFGADLVGAALLFLLSMLDFAGRPIDGWWYDNITHPVSYDPFASLWGVLCVTLCVGAAALCIYWFNRKFCLKKALLTKQQRHKLALSLALFTAPYLFYLPTAWFY